MVYSGNNSFNNTVSSLQARGFAYSFSFINEEVVCAESKVCFSRYEFSTVEMHFYPGEDHTTPESMLYAINVPGYDIKGLLVINGVNNNISFLEMMNRKAKPPLLDTAVSIEWKYLMTADIFY